MNKSKTDVELRDPRSLTGAPADQRVRSEYPEDAVADMAASIKENGLLNPIEVDQNGVIVTGHLRWMGAVQAEVEWVPVRVMNLDGEAAKIVRQLVENLVRTELPPLDTARALERLQILTDWTQSELARATNISYATVARLLPLTKEPERVQQAIQEGVIGYTLIAEANKFPAEVREKVKDRLVNERFATLDALQTLGTMARAKKKDGGSLDDAQVEELLGERDYRVVHPPVSERDKYDQPMYNAAIRLLHSMPYIKYGELSGSTQMLLKRLYGGLGNYLGTNKHRGLYEDAVETEAIEAED